MCTQSVGLLAAVIERAGIPTACIALVRSVAERLRAPRALAVPFPFGHPLGDAGDADGQRAVLRALLDLLNDPGPAPVLRDFTAQGLSMPRAWPPR